MPPDTDGEADTDDAVTESVDDETITNYSLSESQLGCFKTFAPELLQTIFWFVAIDYNGLVKPEAFRRRVASLCLVCQQWRDVARRHSALWTEPPPIYIGARQGDVGGAWRESLDDQLERFESFAARSGALPLTVTWACDVYLSYEWNEFKNEVTKSLFVLVTHCRRWRDANISLIPTPALECLSPARGNLPLLENLTLVVSRTPEEFIADTPYHLDYFSDAPAARSIHIDYPLNKPFHLPSSPLENLSITWNPNTAMTYLQLLHSESEHLQSFKVPNCAKHADIAIPSSPCTLPHLVQLDFSGVQWITTSFGAHLDMLTLPALAFMKLVFNLHPTTNPGRDNFFARLLGMIKRSGCSLQVLELGYPLPVSTDDPVSEIVFEILSLSPRLRSVTLGHPDVDALRRLTFDPTSASPFILPSLGSLAFEANPEEQDHAVVIDFPALMNMFDSRAGQDDRSTERSGWDLEGEECAELEGVHLDGYDTSAGRKALEQWERKVYGHLVGSPDLDTWMGLNLPTNIERAGGMLQYCSAFPGPTNGRPENWKHAVVPGLWKTLEELEAYDFEKINSSILTRLNILYEMNKCSRRVAKWPICPETENLRAFDARLGALLEKWKPFILRDTFQLPYRWTYAHALHYMNIEWMPFDDEDEYWEYLITRNLNDGV